MSLVHELLKSQRRGDIWNMCCGFLDLDVKQFMQIQNNLLLEQIELLKKCKMGQKLLRGAKPATVADYRSQVPLTNYKDYCPELLELREEGLPAKPVRWIQTSGRGGETPSNGCLLAHASGMKPGLFLAPSLYWAPVVIKGMSL